VRSSGGASSSSPVRTAFPHKPPDSVISNWQTGDILIGRLHENVAKSVFCKIDALAV
jgi:hypothetical protein